MSILIKGMKMPENCCECDIRGYDANAGEEYCPFSQIECLSIGRQKDCPIKAELPAKHGRLIDADKLVEDAQFFETEMDVNGATTVIEAEGEG